MTIPAPTSTPLAHFSAFVDRHFGLHFPPDRAPDLQRALQSAAREFNFAAADECLQWLLSAAPTEEQWNILAHHLVVGETYFFRDKPAFEALEREVLPELIQLRRGTAQRLRIWSAACCTGEEAYSLAICVRRALRDLADWHVTILGTDLSPRFLQTAERGVFSEWSFRDTPVGFRESYFTKQGSRHWEILPEIRRMVKFFPLNLATDVYPSLVNGTNGVDLIFCRNALIYFTPERAIQVVGNLSYCLAENGWLVLGPNEVSHAATADLAAVPFPGTLLHQKDPRRIRATPRPLPPAAPGWWSTLPGETFPQAIEPATVSRATPVATQATTESAPAEKPALSGLEQARALYQGGRYAEASALLAQLPVTGADEPGRLVLHVRALANHGKLTEARGMCDRLVAADKMNHVAHYLRASVLQEIGDLPEADAAFKRALYLEPDFVPAHFALGNLARLQGRLNEADRHLGNAFDLARAHRPEDILPETDGLTAGRLAEIIAALRLREAAA